VIVDQNRVWNRSTECPVRIRINATRTLAPHCSSRSHAFKDVCSYRSHQQCLSGLGRRSVCLRGQTVGRRLRGQRYTKNNRAADPGRTRTRAARSVRLRRPMADPAPHPCVCRGLSGCWSARVMVIKLLENGTELGRQECRVGIQT